MEYCRGDEGELRREGEEEQEEQEEVEAEG